MFCFIILPCQGPADMFLSILGIFCLRHYLWEERRRRRRRRLQICRTIRKEAQVWTCVMMCGSLIAVLSIFNVHSSIQFWTFLWQCLSDFLKRSKKFWILVPMSNERYKWSLAKTIEIHCQRISLLNSRLCF